MSYQERFSRNLGIISEVEQIKIKNSCVAIAGLGGVGGAYAHVLARMGVGKFKIADFDIFELPNRNRQAGAYESTLGQSKAQVIKNQILDIQPDAEVEIFSNGITAENISEYLVGCNLVMDGIDFYALPARRLLFNEARSKGIPTVTSGPIGLTTTLHVFTAESMSFEEYFNFKAYNDSHLHQICFLVGVTPALLHIRQIDSKYVNLKEKKAPSFGTAIQLCAGVAGNEAMKILTGRGSQLLAPRYLQFDPNGYRLKVGYLWMGNRNPIQQLKIWFVSRMLKNKN